MKNIQILLFFISFCIYFSQQEEYNITIKEDTYVIDTKDLFSVRLNFTAEDNGTYVFIFGDIANIIEATGDIHEDIYISTDAYHLGYKTRVYTQNFSQGDYVIAYYPYKTPKNPNFSIIKIQKIDAYFRLFLSGDTFLQNLIFNDCSRPTYFFLSNDVSEPYQYMFHGKIHSGEFSLKIQKSAGDSIKEEDLEDIQIDTLTDFPLYDLNIIKCQCISPGFLSIYLTKETQFDTRLIAPGRTSLFTLNYVYSYSQDYSKSSPYIYFEGFSLVGNISFDLREINGSIYTGDFYANIYFYQERSMGHSITVKNLTKQSLLFCKFYNGLKYYELAKEKEEISFTNKNVYIAINKNESKQYIKVTSPNDFYWFYDYSQSKDINFLDIGTKEVLVSNVAYIRNPYTYQPQITDYNWFIGIKPLQNKKTSIKYKYVNSMDEEDEEEEKKNDDEEEEISNEEETDDNNSDNKKTDKKDNNNNSSFFSSPITWIVFILIIVCAGVALYFFKFRKKNVSSSDIEKLVNEVQS